MTHEQVHVKRQHAAHGESEQRRAEQRCHPKAPRHGLELRIALICRGLFRLQRHAALGTCPGLALPHLGIHRADPDRACRLRELGNLGLAVPVPVPVPVLVPAVCALVLAFQELQRLCREARVALRTAKPILRPLEGERAAARTLWIHGHPAHGIFQIGESHQPLRTLASVQAWEGALTSMPSRARSALGAAWARVPAGASYQPGSA